MKKSVIFASLVCTAALSCAHAQSHVDTANPTRPTLISYADATPAYGSGTRTEMGGSAGTMTKDAVRAQVVGQLRQTVHDSELAGLKDIYTRP